MSGAQSRGYRTASSPPVLFPLQVLRKAQVLPQSAKNTDEEARVVNNFGARIGGKLDADGVGVKKTCGFIKCGLQGDC